MRARSLEDESETSTEALLGKFALKPVFAPGTARGSEPLAVASGYLLRNNPVATATGSVPDCLPDFWGKAALGVTTKS
jgi:hypothetical protein